MKKNFHEILGNIENRHDILKRIFGFIPDRIRITVVSDGINISVTTLAGQTYSRISEKNLESFENALQFIKHSILEDQLKKRGSPQ